MSSNEHGSSGNADSASTKRRRFLKAATGTGAVVVTGLVGCTGNDGGGSDGNGEGGSGGSDDDSGGGGSPTLEHHRFTGGIAG